MAYTHTQRGRLHWLLLATAVLFAVLAVLVREPGWPRWVLLGAALLITGLAFCFMSLTVRDAGDALAVRFGPLPLFRTRVPYARIAGARVGRSRLIDGWGVHWVPGRGWTWNLWGFDCVELQLDRGRLRIGTDDGAALVAFLEQRIGSV